MRRAATQYVTTLFNSDTVMKEIYSAEAALRLRAANHIKDKIRAKISDVYYEGFHSREGEPPGKITGDLLRGLRTESHRTVALVGFGPPAHHAMMLEFGTKNMGPRPMLGPTMREEKETVRRILSEEIL